jgi:hypothetical protein
LASIRRSKSERSSPMTSARIASSASSSCSSSSGPSVDANTRLKGSVPTSLAAWSSVSTAARSMTLRVCDSAASLVASRASRDSLVLALVASTAIHAPSTATTASRMATRRR